jgi:hypothetical protein
MHGANQRAVGFRFQPTVGLRMGTDIYPGSCHCGAIGFAYRTQQAPLAWDVRACQCSFCRAHSAQTTSDPSGSLQFREHRTGLLQRYRFGMRITDFLLCRSCGVYIGAEIETKAGRFGIINVHALRPVPGGLRPAVAMDYGSESMEGRMARREARWSRIIVPGAVEC